MQTREPDLFIATNTHESAAVTQLNQLFLLAAEQRISDIHFQENEGDMRVRFRTPAGMQEVYRADPSTARVFDEKIRARAKLSLSDRRLPLDGRMALRYADHGRKLDIRVAITPTVSGELCVCRILDQSNAARLLEDIEMPMMVRDTILSLIAEPNGLFLVTGPTGSGKTTMLYAIINQLNDDSRNIVTIENPVEYQVPGLSQINIDEGLTFAKALKSVLRQDPDIILVGEIRDAETAKIAVEASNTGHLVLATMHANNSATAITRLVELGVDPMTLSTALRGVTAQRLIRKLHPDYEFQREPLSEVDRHWMGLHSLLDGYKDIDFPFVDNPRDAYYGVIPVIEMIVVDDNVRRHINDGMVAIYRAASRQPQFEMLASAGTRLAAAGLTTLSEVRRITSSSDALQTPIKRIGHILLEMGVIDQEKLYEAVACQAMLLNKGVVRRLGEILIADGHCTAGQIVEALGRSSGAPDVGRRLVESQILTEGVLDEAVRSWNGAPGSSLFDRLVANGHCKMRDIYEAAGFSI